MGELLLNLFMLLVRPNMYCSKDSGVLSRGKTAGA